MKFRVLTIASSLCFFCVFPLLGQSPVAGAGSPQIIPQIIENLRLDESSVDDVINHLGKPVKDEYDDFGFSGKKKLIGFDLKSMFDPGAKSKAYRKLTYKKIADLESLKLRFYEGKLVQIILGYKIGKSDNKILATELNSQLNNGFVIFEGAAKESKLADFEGQKQNSVPHGYGVIYFLLSVSSDRVFLALVENNNSHALWKVLTGKPTAEMFPGYLSELQIISRRLEKK